MGRPPEHDEQTRAVLLATAARLLQEKGAAAVTVRGVALEAETTTRAVYSLFGSREGLLRQLFHEAAETMRQHHEAVLESDDPLTEITGLALGYRRAALTHPHAYGLFMGMVPGFDPSAEDRELATRSLRRVLRALKRFVDAGVFPDRDPQALAMQLWAQVHGLATLEIQGQLGSPTRAQQLWRAAIAAHVMAYRQPEGGESGHTRTPTAEDGPKRQRRA